ncbi:hemin uptake protein HemP [Comamonadaceae bacterium G21597-S1]|nr:hemin uptake protein HemP [Comamonadaceae bacterium G21597-S1]
MTASHKDLPLPDEAVNTRRPATPTQGPPADTSPRPSDLPAADSMPQFDSAALLRGHSSVAITHGGSVYRLQATRQGKLILTK